MEAGEVSSLQLVELEVLEALELPPDLVHHHLPAGGLAGSVLGDGPASLGG